MKNREQDIIYCEDCTFYDRSIRPGACSAPQNLVLKTYVIRTSRRNRDVYTQRYKNPEIMRLFGWLTARVFNVCGVEARWFSKASAAEIEARKPTSTKILRQSSSSRSTV